MTSKKAEREWQRKKEDFDYGVNRGLEDVIIDYVCDMIRRAEPLSIPKEVETTDKRTKEEVDAEPYEEPDYCSKDYIGFAGEWGKRIRKDIADGKVCKDYPKGCDDCKDHTARIQSSKKAVWQ